MFALKRTDWIFYLIILALGVLCYLVYPHPQVAMWVGFFIAGYSAIANDSIQTQGTFLSSNKKMPWWALWIFVGGILIATHTYGWIVDGGDIAFQRLQKIPQPTSFTFLSLSAPIMLLLLTKWKMPVSTTFLLLSAFSSAVVIQKMLVKTFMGYAVAFGAAIVVWSLLAYLYHKREFPSDHYNKKLWRVLQLCSTAFLWNAWIMHDTANVAVFLPRTLYFQQFLMAMGYFALVTGVLMYFRGGKIQSVVTEKKDVTDIRAATIIDFTYAIVLVVFKNINNIPMSTTWVFLGLLAGREIALTLFTTESHKYWNTAKLVFKDIVRAGIGLLVSLLIVIFLI